MYPTVSPVVHRFSKHKRAFALLLVLGLFVTSLAAAAFFDTSPVLFQSRESKTDTNGPVFNRVSYTSGWDKDIWVMQQGHQGNNGEFTKWDRIAIVVENDADRSAEFFQLLPGEHSFDRADNIPKRTPCFACHSNGPQSVRPDFAEAQVSGWDKLRIFLWNLRIKSYGPTNTNKQKHDPAFRMQVDVANNTLDVNACTRCHNSKHMFGRGELTRQNFPMIAFMLKEGLMPPPVFSLTENEKKDVLEFIGR